MAQFQYEGQLMEQDIANQQNPLETFKNKTRELEEKQQLLKVNNIRRDNANKKLYQELYQARKDLLQLQYEQYNADGVQVDFGIFLQFEELRNTIASQNKKIESLKEQIARQGMTSSINNKDNIEMKQKIATLENDIEFGQKFTSTQYFRHYLELPSMYKVCFEEVKLEHERKIKVKEQLEAQKVRYQEKKKEILKQLQDKRELYHALMGELHN